MNTTQKTVFFRAIIVGLTLGIASSAFTAFGLDVQIHKSVEIQWQSELNTLYQVQWTTNVSNPVWNNLGLALAGNGTLQSTHDVINDTNRFYRTKVLASQITDVAGNLNGDTNRTYLDILSGSITEAGGRITLESQMQADLPSAGQMTNGNRLDVIWLVDIDLNTMTGQNSSGNDYNIHAFLDANGWHAWWIKVSSASINDGIDVTDSTIQVTASGRAVRLSFPRRYLPSNAFDVWLNSFTGNSPDWLPVTGNGETQKARVSY